MPPAISDDEGSASETDIIPAKKSTKPSPKSKAPAATEATEDEEMNDAGAAENGEGDEDDAEAPEEYVVEKILTHAFDEDGTLKFEVKWLGYEKKSDRTWEPEGNLEGAADVLKEYYTKIGGKPIQKSKSTPAQSSARGKGKRKASPAAAESPAPTSAGKPRGKKAKLNGESASGTPEIASKKGKPAENWEPPKGLWEDEIMAIDTVEESTKQVKTTGKEERELVAYVMWNNGRRTVHPLNVIHKKCPQKMLHYYEQHLVFKSSSPKPLPASTGGMNAEAEK
ncbi:hypothetical protein B0A49_05627 [Cryomyces minteri]|uniref:Chromo domain-containing protein n=1 Tax=Cryomyces minteri TaxID=331657 RepID=A0A4U0WVZ3_9PEZI|nr:hypothetical protein B0A49_05627 [Cryomyces minteri]